MTTPLTVIPRARNLAASLGRRVAPVVAALVTLAAGGAALAGEYEPYTGAGGKQQVSASLFVVLAYSAIWLAVLVFVVMLWRRLGQVREELHRLEERLRRGQRGS